MAPLSGALATNYSTFAGGAGPALDTLAGNDRALSTQLDEAARSDRTGRTSSGTVVNGAAADTNGLAPFTNTPAGQKALRSEEHTSELQSLMRISYAVFCLKQKKNQKK